MSAKKTISTFEQLPLDPKIQKALQLCGYQEPTPIQAQSIPSILERKDLIACAQTGSGKTAAFVLPALQLLCEQGPAKKTRVLILTPTRELANQITKAVSNYGKLMKLSTAVLVGGMPYHHQIKDLARGADIIVATPGRLLDHLEQQRVNLSGIEMLVLDEADRMLDMGFIDDVQYIAKLTPSNRQTLLFSATFDKQLAKIVTNLMKHPIRLDLSAEKISTPKIQQEVYKVSHAQQKTRLLKHFLHEGHIYKAIIFCATKAHTDKLAEQLRDEGFAAGALHGDLRQNVRNRTIEQLRNGKIQFLVATDVAARGIDIRDITHVFNYDLPRFSEDYVHRIGRTGRAGKTGIAISFVGPTDSKHLQSIERYIGQRIKVMPNIEGKETEQPQKSRERKVLTIATEHHLNKKSERPKRSFSKDKARDRKRFNPESERRSKDRTDRPFKDKARDKKRFNSESERQAKDRTDRPFSDKTRDRKRFNSESERQAKDRTDRPFSDKKRKPKKKFLEKKPRQEFNGEKQSKDSGKYRPASIAKPAGSSPKKKFKKKFESHEQSSGKWRKKHKETSRRDNVDRRG